MGYLTNYNYYLNGGAIPTNLNHGSYQYLTLPEVVNNFMSNFVGEDQMIDNVARHNVIFHAKRCIRELNYDAHKSYKAIEIEVDSTLKVVMPHDYVDYIRISRQANGVLYPLTENRKIMSADAYLTDNNSELTFDANGEVLLTSSDLDSQRISEDPADTDNSCSVYPIGKQYGMNTNNANGNSKFRINRQYGVIDFDSSMSGKKIVLEYLSDGMEGGDNTKIMVNKFFETYIYRYITYEILNAKFGIPAVTKNEARKNKHAEWRNARIRMTKMDANTLLSLLRGQNKWIK
jgi:hypothetical protein